MTQKKGPDSAATLLTTVGGAYPWSSESASPGGEEQAAWGVESGAAKRFQLSRSLSQGLRSRAHKSSIPKGLGC